MNEAPIGSSLFFNKNVTKKNQKVLDQHKNSFDLKMRMHM